MVDDGDDGGGVVEWGMCVGGWVVYFGMFCERGFSHITVTAIVIRDCLKQSITVHIETKHCEGKLKLSSARPIAIRVTAMDSGKRAYQQTTSGE